MVVCLFVLASGVSAADSFTDTNHWAKHSIDYVTELGLFNGTTATTFSPNEPMTRSMFVAVLARCSGDSLAHYSELTFHDVDEDSWYFEEVAWAQVNSIVNGSGTGTFAPEAPVTRQDACVILSNYIKKYEADLQTTAGGSTYKDDRRISNYARDAVYLMQQYKLLIGSKDAFAPQDFISRGQAATVFARLYGQFFPNYKVVKQEIGSLIGEFKSTFYCPGTCCNGSYAGHTATGAVPTPGRTLSVDPSVIPLGSRVRLEFTSDRLSIYNGIYYAEDTGGSIRGNKIDLLVDEHDECMSAGVGTVNIYLLD